MRFKIGDKVRIVSNMSRSKNEVGDVGEITCISSAVAGFKENRVTVEGRPNRGNWHHSKDLELVWQPKRGEMVEVRDYESNDWIKREYITTCYDLQYPYVIKDLTGLSVFSYKQMRQIKEDKLDIKITVNGEEKTIEELNKLINK